MRASQNITIEVSDIKNRILAWSQQFNEVFWFDSNLEFQNQPLKHQSYDAVLAVGAHTSLICDHKNAFEQLKKWHQTTKDYLFGYLSYDLKNDIEQLVSNNFDGLYFPELIFVQPIKILLLKGNQVTCLYLESNRHEIDSDWQEICNININQTHSKSKTVITPRISKEAYQQKIDGILNHIHRGDIYEVNFCQEFYSEEAKIDPLSVYLKLNDISNPPFASFVKINQHYLLSASPERFIKKQGHTIISQPIKGTARRSEIKDQDAAIAMQLQNDPKERAENIMIVDLVRNDLAKTALKGSVTVEELCGLYSFKQVHQLVSTISSKVDEQTNAVDIIKSLFPMGSMTGAPKISAMEIIETFEETKRGLYSGAVGYLAPNGDFDFNVVIRSILYNQSNQYLSFSVGGAITAKSDPEKEYDECMIKAKAMKSALNF